MRETGRQQKTDRHPVREWAVLMAVTCVIFLVLMRKFIFGDADYLYSDIGSDSVSSSFPILAMLGRMVQTGDLSSYRLDYGLGGDTTYLLLQYLNPFKFFMLFFHWQDLPGALLFQLFVQTIATAWFAWLYFRKLSGNQRLSIIPAVVWTYAGYIVLWSQNLSFGTCMLMFTITMYVSEAVLSSEDRRWPLALSGVLAVFFLSNYYFYYMTGVFLFIYILVRNGSRRQPVRETLKKMGTFFVCATGSLLLSALSLVLILDNFTSSSRRQDVAAAAPELVVDLRRALTFLGRMFSTNLLGIGNSYTGEFNYYEAAVLSTSLLVLFAAVYLVLTKKTRARTLWILALCAVGLLVPRCWKILNIEASAQRFSFMVCFAECIMLMHFLAAMETELSRGRLCAAVILSELVLGLSLAVLAVRGPGEGIALESREVKIVLVSAAVYGVILFVLTLRARIFTVKRKSFSLILAAVICLEMVAMNNDTLYLRSYITRDVFAHGFYNSGAEQLMDENIHDTDLFRVMGDPSLNMANAGMVWGRPFTSAYSSTISGSLVSLAKDQGTFEWSRNFFVSSYPQYLQYTFLAGRYMVRDLTEHASGLSEPSLFETVAEDPSGHQILLKNRNALPFGYLYTKELPRDQVMNLDSVDRMLSVTDGFYYSDDKEGGKSFPEAEVRNGHEETPLNECIAAVTHAKCEKKGAGLSINWEAPSAIPAGEFSAVDLAFPEEEDSGGLVHNLHIAMDPAALSTSVEPFQVFFLSRDVPVARGDFWQYFYISREYPEISITLPDGVTGVEIRPAGVSTSHMEFTHIALDTFSDLGEDLQNLKKTNIKNISFAESTYRADISVEADEGGMLCIPLLYSENWTASVDGKASDVCSINGGLMGLPLEKGKHSVMLTSRVPHLMAGAAVSAASLLVYLGLWFIESAREKKKKLQRL